MYSTRNVAFLGAWAKRDAASFSSSLFYYHNKNAQGMPHFCSMSGAWCSQLFLVFAFYSVCAWNAAVFWARAEREAASFFRRWFVCYDEFAWNAAFLVAWAKRDMASFSSSLFYLLWRMRKECRVFVAWAERDAASFSSSLLSARFSTLSTSSARSTSLTSKRRRTSFIS